MNKNMNPQLVAKTMQEFEKANTRIDMSEEMSIVHYIFNYHNFYDNWLKIINK